MVINTNGMKLVAKEHTGYNLRTQYFLNCDMTKHTGNYYDGMSERESSDGITITKVVWSCGCTLVDKTEPSLQRIPN